ncbi:hypothetical protein ACFL39_00005, partial [Gemmatimonadota bacterium]
MNVNLQSSVILALITIGIVAITACDGLFSPSDQNDSVVFRSSFETQGSINAWLGGNSIDRSDEACPGGGKHSARVFNKHETWCYLDLSKSKSDRYLTIRFWAKTVGFGGVVSFAILGTQQDEIWINIVDTNWTQYMATDTLYCPAGHTPRITMGTGDLVYCNIFV